MSSPNKSNKNLDSKTLEYIWTLKKDDYKKQNFYDKLLKLNKLRSLLIKSSIINNDELYITKKSKFHDILEQSSTRNLYDFYNELKLKFSLKIGELQFQYIYQQLQFLAYDKVFEFLHLHLR